MTERPAATESMLDLVKQIATPARYAQTASEGAWQPWPHLARLSRYCVDTIAGVDNVRRLLVTEPPQHGKSELISKYLPAWFLTLWPNKRVILASYEADFAASWGLKAREVFASMGDRTGLKLSKTLKRSDWWGVDGHAGSMSTAGAGGAITGKGADLFVIDDPFKNAEEAQSETIRRKVWEWYQTTVYTRLQPGAALIVLQTRWHVDDLTGRLKAEAANGGQRWRHLHEKAIDDHGNALCPQRFPVETLMQTRDVLGAYYWSALYQGEPIPEGGLFFKRDNFEVVDNLPQNLRKIVRYWDTAGTKDGDYTVGVLMAEGGDGLIYVLDVVRGQWITSKKNEMIEATAERDVRAYGSRVEMWIERTPNSDGLQVAEINIQRWARFGCRVELASKAKDVRARPLQARTEVKQVKLLRGPWNNTFIDELVQCWSGVHDDQADAASGAYNKLVMGGGPVKWF